MSHLDMLAPLSTILITSFLVWCPSDFTKSIAISALSSSRLEKWDLLSATVVRAVFGVFLTHVRTSDEYNLLLSFLKMMGSYAAVRTEKDTPCT